MELTGFIDSINASYSTSKKQVTSIQFIKGEAKVTYGTLIDPYETWTFSNTLLLSGVYGYQEDGVIKQLGFVSLDTVCLSEEANESTPV